MKVGIKKVHEDEWLIHIGYASVRLDRFAVALLQIALEHLQALEHGDTHSTLQSYIKLGTKIKTLDDKSLQRVLHRVNQQDLLILMQLANDADFTAQVLKNSGAILAKQLQLDLESFTTPDDEQCKDSIRRLVESVFKLEAKGDIEFINAHTQYI